jgi:CBS domain containing-hemolysin-like protein
VLITIGLVSIILLTLATGYFVAQEFAYVAVDRGRLRALAQDGDPAAARALAVTARLSFMLSGAQLGITVTALLAGYVAEPYLGQGLAALLGAAGVPTAFSLSVSVVLALLFATVVQMVFGELAPKNLAIARPEALARALARSTLVYLTVAGPLIRLFDAASNRLLRGFGIEPVEELPHGATAEDLDRIIATSRSEGMLDAATSRMLGQGLDFRGRTAADVMVPRVDVVTVGPDAPLTRVVALLDTGHSRFPVVEGAVDEIVGVVSIADVVDVEPSARHTVTAGALAVAPVLVPETLPLPALLERLCAERTQFACVIDEFGGFAGVVGLEDLAEELVGDIRDTDDPPATKAARQADGSWRLSARWRLDEVADATGITLPEHEDYRTLSGLMLQRLGRVAVPGDTLTLVLPPGEVHLRVETVRRHVPDTVTVLHSGGTR